MLVFPFFFFFCFSEGIEEVELYLMPNPVYFYCSVDQYSYSAFMPPFLPSLAKQTLKIGQYLHKLFGVEERKHEKTTY